MLFKSMQLIPNICKTQKILHMFQVLKRLKCNICVAYLKYACDKTVAQQTDSLCISTF